MSSNWHHKRPRSRGGKTSHNNCVRVDKKRHYWWHCLFSNMSGEEIMADINTNWLDSRFKVVPR